ncbi:MAG: YciI family protein [Candidatus Binataceae bacterium]
MLFAVIGKDSARAAELRPQFREQHLQYLRPSVEEKRIVLGGPFTDGSGMLVVMEMDSEQAVKDFFANDPFIKNGVVESVDIRPFRKVLPPA